MEPCLKHTAQQQYAALTSQIFVLSPVANPNKNLVWKIILDLHRSSIQAAWEKYMEATCTCYDARTTLRLGSSWASIGDIANLGDFENFPEDYAQFSGRNA